MTKEITNIQHESYLRPFFKAMMDSGYQWSVLHSADNLPYYSSSDVDIVVAGKISHGIEKIIHKVADDTGWHVIQVLWYDVQYGMYYVLKNEETQVYLAVDILYDPNGLGRYGFKTSQLADNPKFNGVFNQTNGDVEFAYKLVKRIEKMYFTDGDKKLFLEYYQTGDKDKVFSLLSEQYGAKQARVLLDKFAATKNFPDFSPEDFKQFKRHHQIKRKFISLQFPTILMWQIIRFKDRLFDPCGIVLNIPSSKKKDAEMVLQLLKDRMDLSFRSYVTATSKNKLKIVNALITSKLCIVNNEQTNPVQHLLRFHWLNKKVVLEGADAQLANTVFSEDCSEADKRKYIDYLVAEIEKLLVKRVQERSHV